MKKSELEKKILKIKPIKNYHGRYIDYCDYGWHQGIIKDSSICIDRQCKHFYRLYIPIGRK